MIPVLCNAASAPCGATGLLLLIAIVVYVVGMIKEAIDDF